MPPETSPAPSMPDVGLPPPGQPPVFLPNAGKTTEQLKSAAAAEQATRMKALVDKFAGAKPIEEGERVIETPAGPVRAREPAEPVAAETETSEAAPAAETTAETTGEDAVAQDNTGELSRKERIAEAVRKVHAQSAHNKRLLAKNAETERRALAAEQKAAQLQQFQQPAQKFRQLQQVARENPIEAAHLLGLTMEQVAQGHLQEGTPEAKLAAMEKRLNDALTRSQQAEQKAEQDRAAAAKQAKVDAAVSEFRAGAADAKAYPLLQGVNAQALLLAGADVARRWEAKYLQKYGVTTTATPKQVLRYLNDNDYFGKKAAEATETKPKAAATEAPSKAKSKPTPGTVSPKPVSPRTVTSSQTAGAFNRPANFSALSQAERIRALKKAFPGQ